MATADPASVGGQARMRRPRRSVALRYVVFPLLVVMLAVGTVAFLQYRRQVVSYLTHWKGSPTHTEAFVPFAPGSQPALHVAVAGDIGDSGTRLDETARAVSEAEQTDPYDVLLLLGDNVYPAGDPARLPETVFEPFAPVLDHAELLAILGNHDVMNDHGDEQMRALGMPGPWWSKQIGDVLFIGLDSNHADEPEQAAWLEATLRDATRALEDRRDPPLALLGGIPGLEHFGARELRAAVRAIRRAARPVGSRP